MFSVENITFGYSKDELIFENLNFQVKAGEVVSLVGPSGAGKSSLLKCMSANLPLTAGKIYLDGEEVVGPNDKLLPGHDEIAIADQSFTQDEFLTVRENLHSELFHLSKEERNSFIEELLEVFELGHLASQKSGLLSGGEQQRVGMACALAREPKLLLLDEPFVHLDVHLHRSIGNYIRQLAKLRSMKIVLVTHQGEAALAWSDRILFFKDGKIKSKYTPKEAYFKPKSLYEGSFFGELNSVYIDSKQVLFRPVDYSLTDKKGYEKLNIEFLSVEFHGHFTANYFKLPNNKKIVLYSTKEMLTQTQVYVPKN